MDLATALPSTFEPLLGSAFTTTLPDGRVLDLVLEEVGRRPDDGDERPFHLLFRGALTFPGDEGRARLVHERAGVLDLFLVPAAPDAGGAGYVAVFP